MPYRSTEGGRRYRQALARRRCLLADYRLMVPPPPAPPVQLAGSSKPKSQNNSRENQSTPGFEGRPAGVELGVSAALHIGINRLNSRHLHAQRAPGWHSLGGASRTDGL